MITSRSLLGWQIPIHTDQSYGKARILNINSTYIKNLFKNINWNRKDTLKQVKNNIHTKYKVLYTKTLKDID